MFFFQPYSLRAFFLYFCVNNIFLMWKCLFFLLSQNSCFLLLYFKILKKNTFDWKKWTLFVKGKYTRIEVWRNFRGKIVLIVWGWKQTKVFSFLIIIASSYIGTQTKLHIFISSVKFLINDRRSVFIKISHIT